MKAKDIIIILLVIALAVVSYCLGRRDARLQDIQMREAKGRITINLALYETARVGDLEKVQSTLGMIILGETWAFEREFGAPTGTNSFAQRFARAQTIAAEVESRTVPIGSITPGAKVTVKEKKED